MNNTKMSFDGKVFNNDKELLQYVKATHVKQVSGEDLKTQLYEEVKKVFDGWDIQITEINDYNDIYKYKIILTKDNIKINQNAIKKDNMYVDDYEEGNLNTVDGIISSIKNKHSKIINTLSDLNKIPNITKIINFNATYEQDGVTPIYNINVNTIDCEQIHKEFDYFCDVDSIVLAFKKCFISKLEGLVTSDEDWGKSYYIDDTDIDIILARAEKLHKKVRLEILD